jgi:hypothetical protein
MSITDGMRFSGDLEGGAISDVANDATAYAHRDSLVRYRLISFCCVPVTRPCPFPLTTTLQYQCLCLYKSVLTIDHILPLAVCLNSLCHCETTFP